MSEQPDLAAFLFVRYDEEAEIATDVPRGPEWTAVDAKRHELDDPQWEIIGDGKLVAEIEFEHGTYFAAQHIARWDPARVLAEVEAKRRTVVRCQEAQLAPSPMLVHFANQTLWELALPYADHPDYRQEWKP